MILVSVDDHLVEPPGPVRGPAPGRDGGLGATGGAHRRRHRRVGVRGHRDPQRRAQRRRRSPAGGVRGGADLLRRDPVRGLRRRPTDRRHGRQRRPGVPELPVVPPVLRTDLQLDRRQGPRRSPSSGPTTTGTSRRGARRTPAGSSRSASSPTVDPELMAAEVRRLADMGCHAVTWSENPEKLGLPSFHSDHWDPFWAACEDLRHHRLPAHRLVQPGRDHLARGAGHDHAHPPAGQPAADGRRPPLVTDAEALPAGALRPLRGRHRLDPLLPRAGRLRVPQPPGVDRLRLRGPAAERGLPGAVRDLLHRRRPRPRQPPQGRHRDHLLGGRLPALGLDLARVAGAALGLGHRGGPHRRRDRRREPPERGALVRRRPLRAPAPRRVHGGGPAGRGLPRRHPARPPPPAPPWPRPLRSPSSTCWSGPSTPSSTSRRRPPRRDRDRTHRRPAAAGTRRRRPGLHRRRRPRRRAALRAAAARAGRLPRAACTTSRSTTTAARSS